MVWWTAACPAGKLHRQICVVRARLPQLLAGCAVQAAARLLSMGNLANGHQTDKANKKETKPGLTEA